MYCGIDVGKKGAIAILNKNGDIIHKEVVPLVSKKELDFSRIKEISKIISDNCKHAAIENVKSIYGSSANSNFQFGRIFGNLEMLLHLSGVSVLYVKPKDWQKVIWSNLPTLSKNPKENSLNACKLLFPEENLLATKRSSVPHDGLVDAILIAEYCRRFYK
jgi:hypothetical protein